MLKILVSHSCDPDSEYAIQEVLENCLQKLEGAKPNAGILLAARDYEDYQILLNGLDEVFPGLELIGGTTNSELSSQEGFQRDSLVLILFVSDTVEIRAGLGKNIKEAPREAAIEAATQAKEKLTKPLKLCLTLPDGLNINGTTATSALEEILSSSVPVVGGTTSEHFEFEATYQFFKTQVLTNALPILVFAGDLKISVGVNSGWQPFGTKGVVTKSDENVVHEIDNQPARLFYSRYFGDLTLEPNETGLAVFDSSEEHFYVRALQHKHDIQETSLSFMGCVPEGAIVQITEAERSNILVGSEDSVKNALATYPGEKPEVLLCFSCAGRRVLLGKEAHREYETIRSVCTDSLPIAGFYSYGEIAPLNLSRKSQFHNFTLISLFLGTE